MSLTPNDQLNLQRRLSDATTCTLIIPGPLMCDSRLSHTERVLCAVVWQLQGYFGHCSATNADLAAILDCCAETVRKLINHLISKGILSRELKGSFRKLWMSARYTSDWEATPSMIALYEQTREEIRQGYF
jgi:predicted transcriptional regulator